MWVRIHSHGTNKFEPTPNQSHIKFLDDSGSLNLTMPNYRRYRIPGGSYFFTVNLLERNPNDLLIRHIDVLRKAVQETRKHRPFYIDAWVVLPDHRYVERGIYPVDGATPIPLQHIDGERR